MSLTSVEQQQPHESERYGSPLRLPPRPQYSKDAAQVVMTSLSDSSCNRVRVPSASPSKRRRETRVEIKFRVSALPPKDSSQGLSTSEHKPLVPPTGENAVRRPSPVTRRDRGRPQRVRSPSPSHSPKTKVRSPIRRAKAVRSPSPADGGKQKSILSPIRRTRVQRMRSPSPRETGTRKVKVASLSPLRRKKKHQPLDGKGDGPPRSPDEEFEHRQQQPRARPGTPQRALTPNHRNYTPLSGISPRRRCKDELFAPVQKDRDNLDRSKVADTAVVTPPPRPTGDCLAVMVPKPPRRKDSKKKKKSKEEKEEQEPPAPKLAPRRQAEMTSNLPPPKPPKRKVSVPRPPPKADANAPFTPAIPITIDPVRTARSPVLGGGVSKHPVPKNKNKERPRLVRTNTECRRGGVESLPFDDEESVLHTFTDEEDESVISKSALDVPIEQPEIDEDESRRPSKCIFDIDKDALDIAQKLHNMMDKKATAVMASQ